MVVRDENGNLLPMRRHIHGGKAILVTPLPYGKILRLFRFGACGNDLLQIGKDHLVRPDIAGLSDSAPLLGPPLGVSAMAVLDASGMFEEKDKGEEERQKYMENRIEDMHAYTDYITHERYGYKFIGDTSIYKLTMREISRIQRGDYEATEKAREKQRSQQIKQTGETPNRTEPTKAEWDEMADFKEEHGLE